MGGLAEWLRSFRDLHERARQGVLRPGEESSYHSLRDELARAMLAAQKLTRTPGDPPRRALRVARALQLDVEVGGVRERTVTLDLSTGGFSAMLARPPALGELVGITLRLPAAESLACRARVTDVKPLSGSVRIAAQFADLPAADLERLEVFIIDTVLGMFAT
jgi:PilZ domain